MTDKQIIAEFEKRFANRMEASLFLDISAYHFVALKSQREELVKTIEGMKNKFRPSKRMVEKEVMTMSYDEKNFNDGLDKLIKTIQE